MTAVIDVVSLQKFYLDSVCVVVDLGKVIVLLLLM